MQSINGSAALTIVHPCDPLRPGIGGFDTCLHAILKYAPAEWEIEMIGITTNPKQCAVRKWQALDLYDRTIRFYPVMGEPDPDRVRKIPLSFRFAAAGSISGVRATGKIVQFHRFESSYAIRFCPETQHPVYFMHNDPVQEVKSTHSSVRWKNLQFPYFSLLRRRLARAMGVVAVHPETLDWIKSEIGASASNVFVLQQWADPEIFFAGSQRERRETRLELRSRLQLEPDTKIVVFAGRLEKQKDPELLIQSFALLNKLRSDVMLLIIGNGRMEAMLRNEIAKKGLQYKVRLEPAMCWTQLSGTYRGCDVAVCTSAYEAGPRQMFEALACGIPVVCADVGQARDVIPTDSMCGTIVRSRDAMQFAHAIANVIETTSAETVDRCRRVVSNFSPQNALAELFRQYNLWIEPSNLIDHAVSERLAL